MGERIALEGTVALAVGEVFQQGGHGIGLGIVRQPQPRGEAGAVAERDPDILDLAHTAGQKWRGQRGCRTMIIATVWTIRASSA